jgi:hypothetical protein
MTVVMGCAAIAGIVTAVRGGKRTPAMVAVGVFVLGAVLQFAAFRVSTLPGIARR